MPTLARSRFANDAQTHRRVAGFLRTHGVAIHLRTIERRQIGIGDDLLSEYAIESLVKLYTFSRQRPRVLPNDLNSFRYGNHPVCLMPLRFLVLFSGAKNRK